MTERDKLVMAVDAALAKACLMPSEKHNQDWEDARMKLAEFDNNKRRAE